MHRMCRQGIDNHTWSRQVDQQYQSNPVWHCKVTNNNQQHVLESNEINSAHVDENEEEWDVAKGVVTKEQSSQHL